MGGEHGRSVTRMVLDVGDALPGWQASPHRSSLPRSGRQRCCPFRRWQPSNGELQDSAGPLVMPRRRKQRSKRVLRN